MKDHQENCYFLQIENLDSCLVSPGRDDNEISELSDKFDCVGAMVEEGCWLEVLNTAAQSYKYYRRLLDHSSLPISTRPGTQR